MRDQQVLSLILSLFPLALILGATTAGIMHRDRVTPWSGWSDRALFGVILLCLSASVVLGTGGSKLENTPLKLIALVAGLALAPVAIYLMLAGASDRKRRRETRR